MTVQQRLTIAFVALLAALIAALGLFEVLQLRAFFSEAAGVRIRAQAKPTIDQRFIDSDGALDAQLAVQLATDLTSASTGALVLGSDGALLGQPRAGTVGASPPRGIPAEAVGRALEGDKEVNVVRSTTGDRELLVLVPVPPGQTAAGVIVLATPLTEEDLVVQRQILVAGANLLAACALGTLLGPPLIRRALRPLRRIAETSRSIAAGDLSQRADLDGPDDEITSLARSFDAMAASLQQAFADLADSEARMRTFVADASHELRTPLTALGGYADVLLRDGADPEGSRRLLAGLHREVSRMQRLVDDLLTLARMEAGLEIDQRPVDLRALAESVSEQLGGLAGDRSVTVGGPTVHADADADRIRQVLLNLMSNALRHTEETAAITITLASEPGWAVIAVSDDGEGMDPATRQRAFERFARGSEPRRGAGAGLGLAIVAAIVDAHDGQVSLESAAGVGTTVTVRLPAAAATPERAARRPVYSAEGRST